MVPSSSSLSSSRRRGGTTPILATSSSQVEEVSSSSSSPVPFSTKTLCKIVIRNLPWDYSNGTEFKEGFRFAVDRRKKLLLRNGSNAATQSSSSSSSSFEDNFDVNQKDWELFNQMEIIGIAKGKPGKENKPSVCSRVYLNPKNRNLALLFCYKVDGLEFPSIQTVNNNSNNNTSSDDGKSFGEFFPCTCELLPYDPESDTQFKKQTPNRLSGTILTDPQYLSFIEDQKAAQESPLNSSTTSLADGETSKPKISAIALFLSNQKKKTKNSRGNSSQEEKKKVRPQQILQKQNSSHSMKNTDIKKSGSLLNKKKDGVLEAKKIKKNSKPNKQEKKVKEKQNPAGSSNKGGASSKEARPGSRKWVKQQQKLKETDDAKIAFKNAVFAAAIS